MFRKRRRRFKRRIYSRRKRYRRFSRALAYKRNTKEVKLKTLVFDNKAANEVWYTTRTASLHSSQNTAAQFLDNIAVGANYADRIGNQIFVKSIVIDIIGAACPGDGEVDNALYRFIVHNAPNVYNTQITDFFSTLNLQSFNAFLNRKNYNIYHDSYTRGILNSSIAVVSTTNTTGSRGHVFRKRIRIPLNRKVEFNFDGKVKNDRDRISLACLAYTPWCTRDTDVAKARQVACMTGQVRIYYTDS